MPRLILASTSPYRKKQLEQLGVPFDAIAPGVDEEAVKSQGFSPRKLAEKLAIQKAQAVARDHDHAAVVGGDQLVSFEGKILGKPGTRDKAVEQLLQLSGKPHDLITAVAICHEGKTQTHVDETRLWMRSIDRQTAERYVAQDNPSDCAGAYKIESRGISLFERIETEDHTAITGLPLLAITKFLNELGIPVP